MFASDPIPDQHDIDFIVTSRYPSIYQKYQTGFPDEIDCPSCDHPVYFRHAFMEIQSIIKNDKPSTINKIQFDYAEFFSRANHVVSVGYSFPKDDIINSVFIRNLKIRKDDLGRQCKLTFIGSPKPDYFSKTWYRVGKLKKKEREDLQQTLAVAREIFGENIRLNFMGFPDVLKRTSLDDILKYH